MDLCPPVAILHRQKPTYTHVRKTETTSVLRSIGDAEKLLAVELALCITARFQGFLKAPFIQHGCSEITSKHIE